METFAKFSILRIEKKTIVESSHKKIWPNQSSKDEIQKLKHLPILVYIFVYIIMENYYQNLVVFYCFVLNPPIYSRPRNQLFHSLFLDSLMKTLSSFIQK